MELKDPNYHQKLIEMCDCYMDTDFVPQIKKHANGESADPLEDAFVYLALAIMYSISEKARKLSFKKKAEKLSVMIKTDEKKALPSPPPAVFDKILEIMRTILHIEDDKGDSVLALGLKNDEIDVRVKMERENNKESLKFKFPDLGG